MGLTLYCRDLQTIPNRLTSTKEAKWAGFLFHKFHCSFFGEKIAHIDVVKKRTGQFMRAENTVLVIQKADKERRIEERGERNVGKKQKE